MVLLLLFFFIEIHVEQRRKRKQSVTQDILNYHGAARRKVILNLQRNCYLIIDIL